jgi:hypothetical protein
MASNVAEALAIPALVMGFAIAWLIVMAFQRRKARSIFSQMQIDIDRARRLAEDVADAAIVGNLELAGKSYVQLRKLAMAELLWQEIGGDFVEAACHLIAVTAVRDPPAVSERIRELRAFLCRTDIDPLDCTRIRLALQMYRTRWKEQGHCALVDSFDEFLAFAE